jgi:F0F1-type ATP synthase membrane subunit a
MSFFIVPIELISYVARVFSLAIRLFANMMSGHGLLKILAALGWSAAASITGFEQVFFLLVPATVIFLVTFLEVAIAFLQAYVFTVLISIYLNDVIIAH